MRKLFYAACVAAMCACQSYDFGEGVNKEQTKQFNFHVKGEFTTAFEDMTRAAVRLEESNTAGVTDLWVSDYATVQGESSPVLSQTVHQKSTDDGFGSVPMTLTYGHHDIKFIASKGTGASLTASALSWTKAHDTFVLSYPVDVTATSNGNRAPELKRAISGLKVVISDAIPQDAKTIVLTLGKRSQTLALPSLEAQTFGESSVELDCTANRGVKGASAAIYTLAGDEEWTSTASISVKREDGSVITSFNLPDVELRKNRMTTLTGEVFNRTSGFSVAVDASWEEPLDVAF